MRGRGRRRRGEGMDNNFRLSHASATTEKAVEAAARIESIVGAVINGDKRAWAKVDMEDMALLVQLTRDAAAAPDWLSQIALRDLLARAEAAEQRAVIAEARFNHLHSEIMAARLESYCRAINDACGLLDEPHRSTVRSLSTP